MHSEKIIQVPQLSSLKEVLSAEKAVFELYIQFTDTIICLKTNHQDFARKCRDHFRACLLEPEQKPNQITEISLFYLPPSVLCSIPLTDILFTRLRNEQSESWIRVDTDYMIFYQLPDFFTYYEKATGYSFGIFGSMNFLPQTFCKTSHTRRLKRIDGSTYFSMLCDHLYLLIVLINQAVCFHGALVRLGTRTVLLAGQSGQGKSTTALSLLRDGATLLSDEIVFFTSSDNGILAEGIPIRPLLVSDASIQLSDLEKTLGNSNKEKYPVDLTGCLGKLGIKKKFPVDAILFFVPPEISGRKQHQLAPLGEMDAFERLTQQVLGYDEPCFARQRLNFLLDLASSSRSYAFTPSSSLVTLSSFLADSLQ